MTAAVKQTMLGSQLTRCTALTKCTGSPLPLAERRGPFSNASLITVSLLAASTFLTSSAAADSEAAAMRMFSASSDTPSGSQANVSQIGGSQTIASLVAPFTSAPLTGAPIAPVFHGAEKIADATPAEQAAKLNEQGVEKVLQGNRTDGIAIIKQALANDPRNTTVPYNLAGLYLAEGESKQALSLMERALELEPNELSFLNRYAEACIGTNDISKGLVSYERIAAADPSFNEVLLKLGTVYAMQKNWPKAEEMLLKAQEVMGNDPRVLSNLGSILVVQEKYADAIPVLEKAQSKLRTAENAVVLGIASESLGKLAEAIRYYREAQSLGEGAQDLEQHIAKLEELPQSGPNSVDGAQENLAQSAHTPSPIATP